MVLRDWIEDDNYIHNNGNKVGRETIHLNIVCLK